MLTYYLKKFTNIFAEIYPLFAPISKDYEKMSQIFIGSLIMRHMGQLVYFDFDNICSTNNLL